MYSFVYGSVRLPARVNPGAVVPDRMSVSETQEYIDFVGRMARFLAEYAVVDEADYGAE